MDDHHEHSSTSTDVPHAASDDNDAAQRQVKFKQDWQQVRVKLEKLKKLDPCFMRENAFNLTHWGATSKRYEFAPPASVAQIKMVEEKLGASLPAELAYFYTTIGNGGAGPFGGVAAVEALTLFKIDKDEGEEDNESTDYSRNERLDDDDRHYLESQLVEVASRDWEFYASGTDQVLVMCGGKEDGSVLVFTDISGDLCYFHPLCDSLAEFYLLWLDHELAMYEVARKLVLASESLAEAWNLSDEILDAEQKNWGVRLLEYRERICSTMGWLHFNKSDEFLEWLGCVLGENMMPKPYTNRPDLGGEPLSSSFRAARMRYLEARSEEGDSR